MPLPCFNLLSGGNLKAFSKLLIATDSLPQGNGRMQQRIQQKCPCSLHIRCHTEMNRKSHAGQHRDGYPQQRRHGRNKAVAQQITALCLFVTSFNLEGQTAPKIAASPHQTKPALVQNRSFVFFYFAFKPFFAADKQKFTLALHNFPFQIKQREGQ